MLDKLNYTINPNLRSTHPTTLPTTAPQSSTLGAHANINRVISPIIALPPTNLQLNSYRQAEASAYTECEALGRRINSFKFFIRDLDNLNISNHSYVLSIKQHVGITAYNRICEQLALALNGNANCADGERLLNENFRLILCIRNREGQNPLEQILASLNEKLALQRSIATLNAIGTYLSQASGLPQADIHQKNYLRDKAVEAFKGLHHVPKGALCEKIWSLDSDPTPSSNPTYGYDEILKDVHKLLHYKDTSPIQDAIRTTTSKAQEAFVISISYVHDDKILKTDSKETIRSIMDVYQLEDLKKFIDDRNKNNDFLAQKFRELNPNLRQFITKLAWLACNKPNEFRFGENFISQDVRVLTHVLKDDQGVDLLTQLISHHQQLMKGQRLIDELNKFSLDSIGKDQTQLGILFNDLSQKSQEDLRHRVWFEDGGKNDPHFGTWDHATRKINENPLCLFTNPNPFLLHLTELKQKITNANTTMLAEFERISSIPDQPINVSSKKLLDQPGLIQKLPPDLRTAFVTAEFLNVANLGGLAPAVDGMVRGMGLKSRVIMPLYRNGPIADNLLSSMKEKPTYELEHYGRKHKVFKVNVNGIRVYLLDEPELFWIPKKEDGTAGNFYDGHWNQVKRRWAVFESLAEQITYKMSKKETNPVQLVHLHDSQTALVPKLLATRHPEEWKQGKTPATVFTFHNNLDSNPYEDDISLGALQEIGLPRRRLNPFIEGLTDADEVTTVSETWEKKTLRQAA